MFYSVNSRACIDTDTELANDLMLLDVISNFNAVGEGEVTITEDEVIADLPIAIEVIGTEMVDDVEVEVTNRQALIDTVELETAEWQEAKIHNCTHDESISHPCGAWEVCQQHGEVPVNENI